MPARRRSASGWASASRPQSGEQVGQAGFERPPGPALPQGEQGALEHVDGIVEPPELGAEGEGAVDGEAHPLVLVEVADLIGERGEGRLGFVVALLAQQGLAQHQRRRRPRRRRWRPGSAARPSRGVAFEGALGGGQAQLGFEGEARRRGATAPPAWRRFGSSTASDDSNTATRSVIS